MSIEATLFPIVGELTIYRAAELCAQMKPLLASGSDIELDLSGVTDIDSAGLQILLAATKSADANGRELRLVKHNSVVTEAIETLGLSHELCIQSPPGFEST